MNKQEILRKIANENDLLFRYHVTAIYLFGSYATGNPDRASDVDLYIELREPISYFQFLDLKEELEELLGLPIDLATKESLHPALKDQIIKEAIRAA